MHKYTNATITGHICTVTVARVFTVLIISSLSYVWLSSQLFLSHFITTFSFSHLNFAKPISFSFFFEISSFEDEDDDSSAKISRATNWVQLVSELGTSMRVTENWSDRDICDRELIGREQFATGCGWLCSASIRVEIHGRLGVGIQVLNLRQESVIKLRVPRWEDGGWPGDFVLFNCWWWLVGWVWVILGLCWVCSSTEKTVAWWRRRKLGMGDFGFVLGLWEGSREEREGNNKNVKRRNILLNKCVE